MSAIFPVVLSGGSGTRLWPLSRTMYPKQFIRFFPMVVTPTIWVLALLTSAIVGLLSSALPSYHASQVNIVDGLRHIG